MKRSLVYGSMAVAVLASVGMAQSVNISNGVTGDGHLDIDVDGYGGYSNWGWAQNNDRWDPVGPYAQTGPMFAGWFGLYSNGTERVAFAEPFFDIDNTYNLRSATFDIPTPSNPQVNGAGDTATSAWSSASDPNFGAIIDISFDFSLVQTVAGAAGAPATLTQALTITNTSITAVDIEVQRHLDIDHVVVAGSEAQDVVGAVDGGGGVIIPYQRAADGNFGPGNPSTISLTSPTQYNYVGGKSGFDGGGGTLMAFGTDFQIWDNFGYPTGWSNFVGGVGHAPTTGELPGAQPAGSVSPWDAFINIEWRIHLEPGASTTVTAVTTYGEAGGGGGCPCACNMDLTTGPGVCDLFDFLAFQGGFVAGDPCQCDIDVSTGPGVCDLFDFLAFQGAFVQGCP